jgi:lysozyme family protein
MLNMGDWRVAKSLDKLLAQVNTARPHRSKSSDGSIGDASHAASTSDHNPWVRDASMGVVTARDITHDPKGGFDSYKCAEVLRTKRDKRIKYVISNRKIFSSVSSPWTWRTYTGANAHDHHVHVSVQSTKALYDNTADWDLGDLFGGTAPSAPDPNAKPVLRRGDEGEAVKQLQTMLKIKADGYFGPDTEAAVTEFQGARKLVADGIVGAYTWAELEAVNGAGTPINNPKMSNIVCTMFGGSSDPNTSAYDPKLVIDDAMLGCALPYRFPGARPKVKVTNRANGKTVVCDIVDVGPWNTTDNYWSVPQGRPQAESGRDLKGRKTNLAGLDITPAADKAIGLEGFGKVDWEFEQSETSGQAPDYSTLEAAVQEVNKCADAVAAASTALANATAALASVVEAVSKPS